MKAKLLGASLLAAYLVVGCAPQNGGGPVSKTETLPASTAEVARQDLVGFKFFDGKVVAPPGIQSDLVAPYELPIEKIYVSVGQRVGKGAPIVKLTMPGAAESLAMAESHQNSAQSSYSAALQANSERVKAAEAALSEARAAEKAARQDVLNGGGSDVTAATEARMEAERELAAARAERDSNTFAERQNLAAANEHLSDMRAGTNQGILRAPISGVVTKLEAKTGLKTTARQLLATVVNVDKIEVQGTVPPDLASEVKEGSKILIALEGMDSDPFEGRITDMSVLPPREGQASPGYLAVISFDNRKGQILPGMNIKRLGVQTGKVEDALVVPLGAITRGEKGELYAHVRNGDQWVQKKIETGLSDGAMVQIKSGLNEGETVRVREITVSL